MLDFRTEGVHRCKSVPVTRTEVPVKGRPPQTANRLGEAAIITDSSEMTQNI